ncbi:sialic acid TRAP transporter substrate-binding protein SiaP [Pelobacter seleniigenes]|uniref:sialic acid TRAP transporter substrate-binding protein SiaP n=1 Tax=Pelobacter seleniigenes TaxID=407188 RepID=UPI0004A72DA6|nr:sialic acid TRAP transporter substrate-binding protein SiaP [Pelobacter seleniigenes]
MKRRFALLLALIIAVSTLTPTHAFAVEKLKWAHVYETSQPYHKWALWAADEIKKRSNGKYEIEVFPASSLGKEVDINEGLSLGTVDIIYTGNQFAGRTYGPISIAGYPYVFRNLDHWKKFMASDLFRDLAAGYEKAAGHKVITATYYGQRHVTAKKEVSTPADMKGLKIRVPNAPAYTIFPKATGANPTPIAFAEVYLALQQGTVDAQENPLPTIQAKKFYEVQKYINLTGHITDSLLLIVGGPLWDRLDDADRKLFHDVLMEAANNCTADVENKEKELVGWFEQQGNIVNQKVDVAAMQKATEEYYNSHPKEVPWPKDIWDRLQAL